MIFEDIFDCDPKCPVLLVYFLVILPVSLSLAPQQKSPEAAVIQEFRAYRLQQFDLQGNLHGSRAWRVSYEATAIGSMNHLRRCLVVWWKDLIGRNLVDLFQPTLGSALVLIPKDLDGLSPEDKTSFLDVERQLLAEHFQVAVYMAAVDSELRAVLNTVETAQKSQESSAFAALWNAVTANAFQIVNTISNSNVKIEKPIHNIVGKLSAYERDSEVPVVAIVAYYDAFGASPSLAFGADSNGSGVAALLEMLRLFHKFYQNGKTRPKFNLIFVLSGGGTMNFQGTRAWIEEQLEQSDGFSQQLEFALCLDGVGAGDGLYMHVSKQPRENGPLDRFFKHLQTVASRFTKNRTVHLVPKKINLGEEFLSWEHERFNIRRLPAFTLSRHDAPKQLMRRSVLDLKSGVDVEALRENTDLIAESLMRYVYNLPENNTDNILQEWASLPLLQEWLEVVVERPRGAQLLAAQGGDHSLTAALLNALDLHTQEQAALLPVNVDKKDPELVLYGATEDTLVIYKVKPAVFDLLLAALIAAYMGLFYLTILKIQVVQYYVQSWCEHLVRKHV